MVRHIFEAEKPALRCLECGNKSDFDVQFGDSRLFILYRKAKSPIVMEWEDSSRELEVTCVECGSQDIEIDDLFFTKST